MSEERINIQFTGKGSRFQPDGRAMDVVIPVGYISLRDLLSHIEYQIGAGTALTDELDSQLAEEHMAGKREMAETLQRVVDKASASTPVDMEAAHRILVAESIGWAPGDGTVGV